MKTRRRDELKMLTYLTGKTYDDWDVVATTEENKNIPAADSYAAAAQAIRKTPAGNGRVLIAGIGIIGLLSVVGLGRRDPQIHPDLLTTIGLRRTAGPFYFPNPRQIRYIRSQFPETNAHQLPKGHPPQPVAQPNLLRH
ncbi:hypothetical protein ACQ86N_36075 [Puia sp. P3]|uniref:hypothetical protein n=1 Tax=Puia sp. P3 TaxID=3423952 RepID=UPI003D66B17F